MFKKPVPLDETLTIGVLLGAFTLKDQPASRGLKRQPEFRPKLPIDPASSARDTLERLVAAVVSREADPSDYVLIPLLRGDEEVYELSQFERESKLSLLTKFDLEWVGLYRKGEPHNPKWPGSRPDTNCQSSSSSEDVDATDSEADCLPSARAESRLGDLLLKQADFVSELKGQTFESLRAFDEQVVAKLNRMTEGSAEFFYRNDPTEKYITLKCRECGYGGCYAQFYF